MSQDFAVVLATDKLADFPVRGNANEDALLGCFVGESAPSSPGDGQFWFKKSTITLKQWCGAPTSAWHQIYPADLDVPDALAYKGALDCSANPNYPAASAGHVYAISVAGKIGGGSGRVVEVGDRIACKVDSSAAGNEATVGANWDISQSNVEIDTDGTMAANSAGRVPAQSAVVTYVTAAVAAGLAAIRDGVSGTWDTLAEIATGLAARIVGPATAANNNVALFDGTTGKLLKDGGATSATGLALLAAASAAAGFDILGAATRFKVGSFTRDLTAASGNVAYTGIGFQPKAVLMIAVVAATKTACWGFAAGAGGHVVNERGDDANLDVNTNYCINATTSAGSGHYQIAGIATFDSDGFTLTWTKGNAPTGTLTVIYLAVR